MASFQGILDISFKVVNKNSLGSFLHLFRGGDNTNQELLVKSIDYLKIVGNNQNKVEHLFSYSGLLPYIQRNKSHIRTCKTESNNLLISVRAPPSLITLLENTLKLVKQLQSQHLKEQTLQILIKHPDYPLIVNITDFLTSRGYSITNLKEITSVDRLSKKKYSLPELTILAEEDHYIDVRVFRSSFSCPKSDGSPTIHLFYRTNHRGKGSLKMTRTSLVHPPLQRKKSVVFRREFVIDWLRNKNITRLFKDKDFLYYWEKLEDNIIYLNVEDRPIELSFGFTLMNKSDIVVAIALLNKLVELILMQHLEEVGAVSYYHCASCMKKIPLAGNKCPFCGAIAPVCIICWVDPEPGEKIVKCSCCGSYAHEHHIKPWLERTHTCPMCKSTQVSLVPLKD